MFPKSTTLLNRLDCFPFVDFLYQLDRSFLVSGFSLKEKSPTITVSSFFSVDNPTLSGPLFLQLLQFYNLL